MKFEENAKRLSVFAVSRRNKSFFSVEMFSVWMSFSFQERKKHQRKCEFYFSLRILKQIRLEFFSAKWLHYHSNDFTLLSVHQKYESWGWGLLRGGKMVFFTVIKISCITYWRNLFTISTLAFNLYLDDNKFPVESNLIRNVEEKSKIFFPYLMSI